MLLLQCKSASFWRKWRKTGDGKCDVHSSHRATASVPEQPTASSPNMKHVWGLICLPLMGCQHSGLRGLQGRRASPPLHQSHWPAPDMSNNFLSGCSLLHIQTHTHTHTPTHTHTHRVLRYVWNMGLPMCIHSFFISCCLVGHLPRMPQSLTGETEDFPGWATLYQLCRISCMQKQLPLISSIFNMHLTPSLTLLFHNRPLVNIQHATQDRRKSQWLGGGEVDSWASVQIGCCDWPHSARWKIQG